MHASIAPAARLTRPLPRVSTILQASNKFPSSCRPASFPVSARVSTSFKPSTAAPHSSYPAIQVQHDGDGDGDMAPKKFEIKTPKGTRDWDGSDMVLRDGIFSKIIKVFERHGGQNLDTPVFELKEILTGKYGEDSKLIYDLADQGGELCSLRYDLTVPFARYLAMNRDIQQIKRYHIAKVYRRDQPAVAKGRMREFYQCDFDIAGTYDPMMPDAEIIRIINEVFESLGWKDNFTIKLNSRLILDGLFEVCGVPENLIRPISSAVDKLDKMPWSDVRKEMVDEKHLDSKVADKIGQYVVLKGKRDLLEKLAADEALSGNKKMQQGITELGQLFDQLEDFQAMHSVSFDLSLARGLDYYTGVIFEVMTEGSAPEVVASSEDAPKPKPSKKKGGKEGDDEDRSDDPTLGIGSVAAGGRYDNLVNMFSSKSQVPCVGISFGIDRIFSITKAKMAAESRNRLRKNKVDVFVMAFGGGNWTGLRKERSQICAKLWDADINAEMLHKQKPKLPAQFKAAEQNGVPYAVILGESELAKGEVRLKQMGLPDGHPEKDGTLVSIDHLAEKVKEQLSWAKHLDEITRQAEGLKLVGGIKSEDIEPAEPKADEGKEESA